MIEVRNLVKKYGDHVAVDNLSFTVEKGQIYGFLGPNGAGKTTTMNIITGCLAATSGDVLVDGHDIYSEGKQAKKLIGYLPEIPPLYLDMTPYEYLCFVGALKGIAKKELKAKVCEAMEKVHITDVKDRLNKNLSKGYKQRVGLAQAILGDPEIIILDEPTVGLDPLQIVEIREVIKSLADEHTVIFSSHILSEVSAICNRIMIISNGRLIAEDTAENLEKQFASASVMNITVKGSTEAVSEALAGVEGIENVSVTDNEDGTAAATIEYADGADISEAVSLALLEKKCLILKMDISKATLEDVFMELVADSGETDYSESDASESEFELDAGELLDGNVKSVWDEHMPDTSEAEVAAESDDENNDEKEGTDDDSNI